MVRRLKHDGAASDFDDVGRRRYMMVYIDAVWLGLRPRRPNRTEASRRKRN